MWIRIQVNKITKFSRHLLIVKSQQQKVRVEWGCGRQQTSAPTFFRFKLEKYDFLRKKKCLLIKLFSFILSVFLYRIRIRNLDLNPDPRTQLNPDPDPHHWYIKKLFLSCFDKTFSLLCQFFAEHMVHLRRHKNYRLICEIFWHFGTFLVVCKTGRETDVPLCRFYLILVFIPSFFKATSRRRWRRGTLSTWSWWRESRTQVGSW